MGYLPIVIDRFRGEYAFLSNMAPAPMVYEGLPYLNSESAFQSAKSTDMNVRRMFCHLSGYDARSLGRKIQLRPDWLQVRDRVMYEVVLAKFQQNPLLRSRLIATENVRLIENNEWKDTYWGVYRGQGRNMLGRILTRVRKELRVNRLIVGVVGSRSFDNYEIVKGTLDRIAISMIVSGGAPGADALGARYAREHEIELVEILPDYEQHGRSAPLVRNTSIVKRSDIVIAFWDGKSRGTLDSIRKCISKSDSRPYKIILPDGRRGYLDEKGLSLL